MASIGSKPKYDRNFDPSERAYTWGYKGIEIDNHILKGWLGWHTRGNLEARVEKLQRRIFGLTVIDLAAIVIGVSVFAAALFVDYNIINEFWTRALSNEFGEVPPSLATTVTAKSMQVLFGTLAIHYLITHIGHGGRVLFSLFIFMISAAMIIGIGLLWANNSLPAGAQIFGFEAQSAGQSVNDFMKSLGVKPSAPLPVPAEIKLLKKYQVVVWLFSLGVIFFVVASIGALSLHSANGGFTGLLGGKIEDNSRGMRKRHSFKDELVHAKRDLTLFKGYEKRGAKASGRIGGSKEKNDAEITEQTEEFVRVKLDEFVTLYTDGLIDSGKEKKLRDKLLSALQGAINTVLGFGEATSKTGNVEHIDDYRDKAAHA